MTTTYKIQALKSCGAIGYSVWVNRKLVFKTNNQYALLYFLRDEAKRLGKLGLKMKLIGANLVRYPNFEEEVFSYTY